VRAHELYNELVFFVIPAHNEGRSITAVIDRVRAYFSNPSIAVINDGSSDDTASKAKAAGAHLINLPFNSGYGVALHTGLIWAYRHKAQLVVTQDADGQHDPAEARKLLEVVTSGAADIALGSRYRDGSQCYPVPLARRIGSFLFAWLLTRLAHTEITDPTTGFQALNARALEVLVQLPDFPERTPDADVLLFARRSGCRILEVPVAMYTDQSNDSMHSVWKSLFYVPKMLIAMLAVILNRSHEKTVLPGGGAK